MKPCPHCGGTGHVRSESSVALLVVRAIEEFLLKDARSNITVRTPASTALYVLNHKRSTLTELFGLSWPASHRVVPNAATEKQLSSTGDVPRLNRLINRITAVGAKHTPDRVLRALVQRQHPSSRFLTPLSATDVLPASFVDAGPLYAGETVRRIHDVVPAAATVAALTP